MDAFGPAQVTPDVINITRLAAYRELRDRSLLQLKTDEIHNVYGQIVSMIDGDRTWRMLNEMRRLAADRRTKDPAWSSAATNAMLTDFIDTGYVATQTLAIRRLLEEKQSNPKGQIISLRRVLAAVKGGRGHITRECFVCHDGLPYDPSSRRVRAIEAAADTVEGDYSVSTEGPEGWNMAEMLHEAFDSLSGVAPERRSRDDLIRTEYFDTLEALLLDTAFDTVEAYANKFVAHSADKRSREVVGEDVAITIDRISTCHAAIIKVFNALVGEVFQVGTHSPVAVRSDPFKGLDKPLIATEQLSDLRQIWMSYGNALDEHVGITGG